MEPIFPYDARDHEEQEELRYNAPLRLQNQSLLDENMYLKKLLRERGIPWNDTVASHPDFQRNDPTNENDGATSTNSRRRRSSRLRDLQSQTTHRIPHLPAEIMIRILQYAVTAAEPIIDPFSKLNPERLTTVEATRGNQINICFLSTCKAYYVEGKRFFWSSNTFTFTTPEALRRFADVEFHIRKDIRHINLRIVARYYDDEKRTHRLDTDYHPDMSKPASLKVIPRHKDPASMSRSGFRSYTWIQTIDFLSCLRPPFDPTRSRASAIGLGPRLLPGLKSIRIDFVNFPDYFLPIPDAALHEIAAHDLGCTLDELMVTGLPCCEVGAKAGADLQGMVRDDGLFMCHAPAYLAQKKSLKALRGYAGLTRVVRSWRLLDKRSQSTTRRENFPPVPEETGHPESNWKKRKTLWKRVPVLRDSEEREWIEFDRNTGESVMDLYGSSDEDVCPNCGVVHDDIFDSMSEDDDDDEDDSETS